MELKSDRPAVGQGLKVDAYYHVTLNGDMTKTLIPERTPSGWAFRVRRASGPGESDLYPLAFSDEALQSFLALAQSLPSPAQSPPGPN